MSFSWKITDDIYVSDEKELLDLSYIHAYLSRHSYWAENIPVEVVARSIRGSHCFGVYYKNQQVGFARVITDKATFGYLADVFIDEVFRGRGLAKQLLEVIFAHPDLQDFRTWLLGTRDAHALYAKFGFKALESPERYMRRAKPDIYKKERNE
jgi:GNAT superfamily N-acetyltransferase